ncbi:MAG: T9SS type A sorting domain-containing protein [Bacteroidales bacterium]|nr:T9SS type A sorting domain-containing protein [Bacteroidales bacterium]
MGVNYGADNQELNNFIEAHNIQFPCASGLDGQGNMVNEQYGIQSYITCIIISPDREIVGQFYGPYYPERDTLNKLLLNLGAEMQNCSVGIGENSILDDITVFPNPLSQNSVLYVNMHKANEYDIRILNNVGQIIYEKTVALAKGDNSIEMDPYLFKKGTYILQIADNYKMITTKKIIIQ